MIFQPSSRITAKPPDPVIRNAGNSSIETRQAQIQVGLLTGGGDRHYAFGLAMALASKAVSVDFVGGDELDSPELHCTPNLTFLNLRRNGNQEAGLLQKVARILAYYARLIRYAANAQPKVLHILWNNKFEFFDRTLLMFYYKLLKKRIILTAHNVNAGRRDLIDSRFNRFTLTTQYRLADHIFVHTAQMKRELIEEFGIRPVAVSVIRYGINNAVPHSELTPEEAKQRLGIGKREKTILFFGNIAPYKGLEYLIAAFEDLASRHGDYRLIVAGRPKKGAGAYFDQIRQLLHRSAHRNRTILTFAFIPDGDMEIYFKAADVSVLPYTRIFQSGVLFLGYSYGLPAIAADVGSLKEDIIESQTGFVCRPQDPVDLAATIEQYFTGDLYRRLHIHRAQIREHFTRRHSWDNIAGLTREVYAGVPGTRGATVNTLQKD